MYASYAELKLTSRQIVTSNASGELTAVGDDNRLDGDIAGASGVVLDKIEDLRTFSDLTEDAVSAVEMRSSAEAEEELAAVGVGASVGHGEDTAAGVAVLEVLISEFLAIDGLATSAVATGEVATLSHEASDDTVEGAALEVEGLAGATDTLLTSAESAEVLGGLGRVSGEGHGDAASSLTTNGDVEEDSGVSHRVSCYLLD